MFGLNIHEIVETANSAQVAALEEKNVNLQNELIMAEESLQKVYDAFDNFGWQHLEEIEEGKGIDLKTVKKISEVCRDMTHNPFVKRAVNARISYIHGRQVLFDQVNSTVDGLMQKYRKKLFTAQAYEELERAAATDGNTFHALSSPENDRDDLCLRIPLAEIAGIVADPDDEEQILYYLRERTTKTTDLRNGTEKIEVKKEWIPSVDHYQRTKENPQSQPTVIAKNPVNWGLVMFHNKVNSMVGWKWGVPDVAAVVFFAKKYKEYLEDNAALVKAYGRLAWEVKGNGRRAMAQGPAQFRKPPERDLRTGKPLEIGGIAFSQGNTELAALPPTGSQVDFSKGVALATAIASGLEVSLIVVTSDPGSGNRSTAETLDLPTLKAMEARQELWKEHFKSLFAFWGDADTEVIYPRIYSESIKDTVSSMVILAEADILYSQEVRKEALDILKIIPYKPWDELPDNQINQKITPAQGVSGGIAAQGGAMSGTNDARDNRAEDENKL